MEQNTPQGMIGAALTELCALAELEGAAIVDLTDSGHGPSLLYCAGSGAVAILDDVGAMLTRCPDAPSHGMAGSGHALMACPWVLPPDRAGGLALWRRPFGRVWTACDSALGAMAAAMLRVMLEHGPDEAGIDRLTGLPNRLYFLDETDRHIERLAQDGIPGTLMVVELDDLEQMALTHGQAARDWMLVRIGSLLRAMVRPADLVGRVGGGTFAVWFDGMDHMTAAERAQDLCDRRINLPEAPGRGAIAAPTLSIGIASRSRESEQDARGLMLHAREAAAAAGDSGGGSWRVWRGGG